MSEMVQREAAGARASTGETGLWAVASPQLDGQPGAGMRVAGFATQASFLLGCGLLDLLADVGATDSLDYLRAASAVQTLVSPAEMGERFKVLLLARGETDIPSLALTDISDRL